MYALGLQRDTFASTDGQRLLAVGPADLLEFAAGQLSFSSQFASRKYFITRVGSISTSPRFGASAQRISGIVTDFSASGLVRLRQWSVISELLNICCA